ncbi:hypothetical protein C791_1784 [Amycolatopsis azurea DSM 43854]|uniref:Uncharacterized protein n=1 Tax=Amycolatopsis azurea DSM 43854 TaxID=1238180 RepID=M2QPZ7_9PSEU|nr:hypothetical protein C791_1784 [Amycolatopsis azurea DSM 43854]
MPWGPSVDGMPITLRDVRQMVKHRRTLLWFPWSDRAGMASRV